MSNRLKKTLARTTNPVIVASIKGKSDSVSIAAFVCNKTGISILTNDTVQPLSPFSSTASVLTKVSKGVQKIMASDVNEELVRVASCSNCKTDFKSTYKVASKLVGCEETMTCLVCASEADINVDTEELENNSPVDEVFTDEELEDSTDEFAKDSEDFANEDLDDSKEENLSEDINEEMDAEEKTCELSATKTSKDKPTKKKTVKKDVKKPVKKATVKSAATEDSENAEDSFEDEDSETEELDSEEPKEDNMETSDFSEEHGIQDSEEENSEEAEDDSDKDFDNSDNSEEDKETVAFNLLSKALTTKDLSKVQLSSVATADGSDNNYYLFINKKPVALSNFKDCSTSVKEIYNNPNKLVQAFYASIASGVTKENLKDFGITPIIIQVPMSDVTKQHISKAIESSKTDLDLAKQNVEAKFKQCVSIASVGILKGFFSECENKLKASLYDKLVEAGVGDAEILIDDAFSDSGESYLTTVLSKAHELYSESDEVRNSTAKYVEQSSYKRVSESTSIASTIANKLSSTSVPLQSVDVRPKSEASAIVKNELFNFNRPKF